MTTTVTPGSQPSEDIAESPRDRHHVGVAHAPVERQRQAPCRQVARVRVVRMRIRRLRAERVGADRRFDAAFAELRDDPIPIARYEDDVALPYDAAAFGRLGAH